MKELMTQTTVDHEQATTATRTAIHEHLVHQANYPDELAALLREQPREALTFRSSDENCSISGILAT